LPIAARAVPVLLATLVLASCVPRSGVRQDDLWQCAKPDSPDCAAAREQLQRVRYPLTADHLVAASNRALGDLNFETRRDDARRTVSGDYFATAPTHPKQLDDLFRQTLKSYAAATVTAQVEVLVDTDGAAAVRLRLYAAAAGAAPRLIDNVAPYQIFFSQLGAELGTPAAPPKEDNPRDRPRPISPSISGV